MNGIRIKLILSVVLALIVILTACSSSTPSAVSVTTNSENTEYAVYFRVLNKNDDAIQTSGTAKLIIYGDRFKSQAEDTPIFTEEITLAKSDWIRMSFPGFTYVTARERQSGKLDPDPWGYKWEITYDEIQHSDNGNWWVEIYFTPQNGETIKGTYRY